MDSLIEYVLTDYNNAGCSMATTVRLLDTGGLEVVVTIFGRVSTPKLYWYICWHALSYCRLAQAAQVELDSMFPGSGFTTRQFMRGWARLCRRAESQVNIPLVGLMFT